jgi:dynein heavy chain, axonemal
VRLWCHEGARIFRDRLVSEEDREWYDTASLLHLQKALGGVLPWEKMDFSTSLYGAFISDEREYRELTDPEEVQLSLSRHLIEYNSRSVCNIDLIFFQYAVSHLARVSRIIQVSRGKKKHFSVYCLYRLYRTVLCPTWALCLDVLI